MRKEDKINRKRGTQCFFLAILARTWRLGGEKSNRKGREEKNAEGAMFNFFSELGDILAVRVEPQKLRVTEFLFIQPKTLD